MQTTPGIAVTLDHLMALRWRLPRAGQAPGRAAVPRPGPAPGRRIGRGLDQEDIRPYGPGDDARHIDWRATARLGRAQVKLFREDRERLRLLVVDLRPCMAFGTRRALRGHAAAELAALCAWDAVEREARLAGLLATGRGVERVRPGRGAQAALGLLGALAAAQPRALGAEAGEGPDLAVALTGLERLARGGASVVLLSAFDRLGEGFLRDLAGLAAGAEVTALRIEDPVERALPQGRYAIRSAGRDGLVDLARPLRGGAELDALDAGLRQAGARVEVVSTAEDPAMAMARVVRALDGR